VADEKDALGVGHAQFAADDIAREHIALAIDFRSDAPGFAVAAQAAAPDFKRAQLFLQALVERAANCHRIGDAFRLCRERGSACANFSKAKRGVLAAFNVGADDKHIATVDEGGVALAAIQGLNEKLKEKDTRIESLEKRLADLEELIKLSTHK